MEDYNVALSDLKGLMLEAMDYLPEGECIYFKRAFEFRRRYKIDRFYLTMQIHKDPIASRPVTDCFRTMMSIYSKWLDVKMAELVINCVQYRINV